MLFLRLTAEKYGAPRLRCEVEPGSYELPPPSPWSAYVVNNVLWREYLLGA